MTGTNTPSFTALARNPGIDLLRGLSIVLVVMHHIGLRIPLGKTVLAGILPKWLISVLIYDGYEAVFIFFVISGFLIASNSIARWGRLGTIDVRVFYVRRAARIVPCLVLLVTVLSLLHILRVEGYTIMGSGQSLPRAIFSAFGLHLNWYEGHTGYLPGSWDVLWSLSIEEVFYLAFPLVCLTLRRNWVLVPVLSLLAISLPVSRAALAGNEIWQEKAYLPGMAAIATGVLGAIVATSFRPKRGAAPVVLCTAGVIGIIAVLCFEGPIWRVLTHSTLLILTFSSVLAVLGFHWLAGARQDWRIPGTAWLQSFGRLSYEVYLTHMFVVFAVVAIFHKTGAGLRWGFFWYLPVLALSWVLGWLVARYVSTPSERAIRARLLRSEKSYAAGNSPR